MCQRAPGRTDRDLLLVKISQPKKSNLIYYQNECLMMQTLRLDVLNKNRLNDRKDVEYDDAFVHVSNS